MNRPPSRADFGLAPSATVLFGPEAREAIRAASAAAVGSPDFRARALGHASKLVGGGAGGSAPGHPRAGVVGKR